MRLILKVSWANESTKLWVSYTPDFRIKIKHKLKLPKRLLMVLLNFVLDRGLALPGVKKDISRVLQKQNYKIGLASSSKLRIINAVSEKIRYRILF